MSAYKFLWFFHIFSGCLVSLNQELNKVYMLHLVVINYTKISLVFNHKCLLLAQVTWGLSWAWLGFAPWIFWSWSPGCRSSFYLDSLFSGQREEPGDRAKLYKYLEGFCQTQCLSLPFTFQWPGQCPGPNPICGPRQYQRFLFCWRWGKGGFWGLWKLLWPNKWKHHRTKGQSILIHSRW